jgi:predicted dienelactone hydrolase
MPCLSSCAASPRRLVKTPSFAQRICPRASSFGASQKVAPSITRSVGKRPDAPGFDRAAYHMDFNAAVLVFFRKHLLGL